MKFDLKRATVLLAMVVLVFCSLTLPARPAETVETPVTVTVAFTHDLHDHLLPLKTLKNNEVVTVGGFARLATAIRIERELDPDLLLVDAGDYAMGTMFQMLFQDHAPDLVLMGQMGYDAVTLGNHEFDYLPQGLARHLMAARESGKTVPKIVASNLVFPEGVLPEDLQMLYDAVDSYPVHEYTVVEKKGVRIGLFGLVGKQADAYAPMAGVTFADQEEAARRMVDALRNTENVDLIVCLSHSGIHPDPTRSEDEILAQRVDGIDVIISGHSHSLLTEPIYVNNTWIVAGGQYGANLGVLQIEKQREDWEAVGYRLIPIDSSLDPDPAVEARIAAYSRLIESEYLAPLGFWFDTVLAYSDFNFTPYDQVGEEHREEPLGNLIADAFRFAVAQVEGEEYEDVAVAVAPSGSIRGSFVQGPITAYDAFVVSSLGLGPDGQAGFPLLSVYLTGRELKAVCEVDASVTPMMKSAQLYMSGIQYTFNPQRLPLNKVTDVALVRPDGSLEAIQDDQLYRLVAGLYSAQMLSVVGDLSYGLLPIVPKDRDGQPITDFLQHIVYIDGEEESRELKEWVALAMYLNSFTEEDGFPQIPNFYSREQGRKNIEEDRAFAAVWGRPNHLAVRLYLLVLGVILVFALLIGLMVRRRGQRKRV